MTTIRDTALLAITSALAAHLIVSLVYGPTVNSAPPPEATTLHIEHHMTPSSMPATIPSSIPTSTPALSDMPVKLGKHSRLDLAFCIDTTGSMQGEIDTVKAKVKSMVAKLSSGQSKPVVRVGLVAYRDKGDEYVTKVFPFSANIDQVVKDISDLSANGGGDGPEAVDMGLHAALNDLHWDNDKHTARLLYLIGDAPAHKENADYDLTAEAKSASTKKICVSTIGCQGVESFGGEALSTFKNIATMTNGSFQSLAYRQELVDSEGHRATLVVSGGKTYKVKSTGKDDWKAGTTELLSHGAAVAVPTLQGATNGTIVAQGSDAAMICGVNTAGTVTVVDAGRVDNNLEDVMMKGAQAAISQLSK